MKGIVTVPSKPVKKKRDRTQPVNWCAPEDVAAMNYQGRVLTWITACFSDEIVFSQKERSYRFLEESLELVQALGFSAHEAHDLVDYVFSRPAGKPTQEVGGVLVCLAALCSATGIDMERAGETELTRIWMKIDEIRAKHANKPDAVKGAL